MKPCQVGAIGCFALIIAYTTGRSEDAARIHKRLILSVCANLNPRKGFARPERRISSTSLWQTEEVDGKDRRRVVRRAARKDGRRDGLRGASSAACTSRCRCTTDAPVSSTRWCRCSGCSRWRWRPRRAPRLPQDAPFHLYRYRSSRPWSQGSNCSLGSPGAGARELCCRGRRLKRRASGGGVGQAQRGWRDRGVWGNADTHRCGRVATARRRVRRLSAQVAE